MTDTPSQDEYDKKHNTHADKIKNFISNKREIIRDKTIKFMNSNTSNIENTIYMKLISDIDNYDNNEINGCIIIRETEIIFVDKFIYDYDIAHDNILIDFDFKEKFKTKDDNREVTSINIKIGKYSRCFGNRCNILRYNNIIHECTKIAIVDLMKTIFNNFDFTTFIDKHENENEIVYVVCYSKVLFEVTSNVV